MPENTLRALVVDDHPFHCKVAELLLRRLGLTEIQTAASGFEAIAHLRAAPFDIVLCDIDMPAGNGPELISALVDGAVPQLPDHLPAWIWVSAMPTDIVESHVGMAIAAGLHRVAALRKPLTAEALEAVLRAATKRTSQFPFPTTAEGMAIARSPRDIGLIDVQFQPQFDLATGELVGAQALMPWHNPMSGTIPPTHFIQRTESLHHANIVFFHVLERSLVVCRQLRDNGVNLSVSVNAPAAILCQTGLFEKIDAMVGACGIPRQSLTIEMSATMPEVDTCALSIVLNRLRLVGYGIAFNDPGGGTATLNLLADLPFTQIILNHAFVRELPGDNQRGTICRHLVALAHALQLQCVAEGVETAAQLDTLRELGCARGQGPALLSAAFLTLALRH